MTLFDKTTIGQLAWPWVSSTIMAIIGSVLAFWHKEAFVVVYGYFPLMAVPFLLCTMHLWPRHSFVTVTLLLCLCYGVQFAYLYASREDQRWIVLLIGALAAVLTGLLSAKLGARYRFNFKHFIALFISGTTSMIPLCFHANWFWVIISVWAWQIMVGTILVVMAATVPRNGSFNMGVLQS